MSAITLSLIIYVTPVVAVIVDFLYYGKLLHFHSIIGMAVIFTGIWITQLNKKRIKGFLNLFKNKK